MLKWTNRFVGFLGLRRTVEFEFAQVREAKLDHHKLILLGYEYRVFQRPLLKTTWFI